MPRAPAEPCTASRALPDIRLSALRALWGCVPPSLRAFSAAVHGETVQLRSVFDGSATAEDHQLLAEAAAEIISDYPSHFALQEEFLTIPAGQRLHHLTALIYLRHERPAMPATPDDQTV